MWFAFQYITQNLIFILQFKTTCSGNDIAFQCEIRSSRVHKESLHAPRVHFLPARTGVDIPWQAAMHSFEYVCQDNTGNADNECHGRCNAHNKMTTSHGGSVLTTAIEELSANFVEISVINRICQNVEIMMSADRMCHQSKNGIEVLRKYSGKNWLNLD